MDGAGGHPQQPCPTPKLLLTCHVFCYALLGLALGDGRSAVASLLRLHPGGMRWLTLLKEYVIINFLFVYWLVRILLDRCFEFAASLAKFASGGGAPSPSPLACSFEVAMDTESVQRALEAGGMRVYSVERFDHKQDLVGDGAVGTKRGSFLVEQTDGLKRLVFVKVPSQKIWLRSFLYLCGLYQNELWFYTQMAKGKLNIPKELMPRVFYAKRRNTRFFLALEDVSGLSPSSSEDEHQSSPKHALKLTNLLQTLPVPRLRAVLQSLAKWHAVYWGRPHDVWPESNRSVFFTLLAHAAQIMFNRKFPSVLPANVDKCFSSFIQNYSTVKEFWACSDLTLVHGDVHSGNVYFKADGSAGFFDFQVVSAENPMRDVTYFLMYAGSEETLEASEKDLIKYYLSCLEEELAAMPGDLKCPTFENAWFMYRMQSFYPLLAAIIPSGLGDFVPDKNAVFAFTKRIVNHFLRVKGPQALEKVLACAKLDESSQTHAKGLPIRFSSCFSD